MNIKGFKAKDGTVYKYDYDALANKPAIPEGPGSGGNANQSGGFSQTLRVAMYNLLMDAVYQSSGHDADKEALAELLTGESGGGTVEPDEPVITYYTIEKILTNVSISNGTATVQAGTAYSATLTADEGYTLDEVTVTMGGEAVTVTDGVIDIASVTGNIVIVATATAESSGETAWTSGTPFDLTGKIIENTDLNYNNGVESVKEGSNTTDYLYCYGVDYILSKGGRYQYCFYDASKNYISSADIGDGSTGAVPENAVYARVGTVHATYWLVTEDIKVIPITKVVNFTPGVQEWNPFEDGSKFNGDGSTFIGSAGFGYATANYIPVGGATKITQTVDGNNANIPLILFYDANKNFVWAKSSAIVPFTIPSGYSFARCNCGGDTNTVFTLE